MSCQPHKANFRLSSKMHKFFLLAIFFLILNAASPLFVVQAAPTTPVSTQATTAAAPADPFKSYLSLGIGNSDIDWISGSGIPLDFRYQYLAGDVTGDNWAKWNTPDGQFATYYMDDSAKVNTTPVFTYYMMRQSSPGINMAEDVANYTNMNNANTMKAYFANFKLLMQKAAAFGKPVIVHVEPDLWGYMQQRNQSAASISASVASSGFGDVASGKPNTVAGFAQTLVALRDKYAPNVTLGYHVSGWGTKQDIGLSTDPSLDVKAMATSLVGFYNSLGANFDVFFWDTSDRDAAYYAQWDNGAHFWDVTNAKLPNFKRYASLLAQINQLSGKKQVLWQTPLGNSKQNNTVNHWKDNRVEYFLGTAGAGYANNLKDFINAGVVSIMFGAGAGDQTSYEDDNNVFQTLAKAYYTNKPLPVGSSPTPTPTPTTNPTTTTTPPAGLFHVVTPFRLYQSDAPNAAGMLGAGSERSIPAIGGAIPSSAKGVMGNLTAAATTGGGFLGLFPNGASWPGNSSLNWYRPNQQVGNFAITGLGSNGAFAVRAGSNSHVFFDVTGYIDPATSGGGSFRPVAPARLYDSRQTGGALAFGSTRTVQVRGAANIPAQANAVAINVTASNVNGAVTNGGFLSVYPGNTASNTATVNWGGPYNGLRAGDSGNYTIVPIASDGTITVAAGGNTNSGSADQKAVNFIVDVFGYIDPTQTASNIYQGITETRVVSTPDGQGGGVFNANEERVITIAGVGKTEKVPTGATAVAVHVAVNQTNGGGFLSLFPSDQAWPGITSLNWSAGTNAASNFAIVPLSADGKIKIRTSSSVQVYLDVVGYIK